MCQRRIHNERDGRLILYIPRLDLYRYYMLILANEQRLIPVAPHMDLIPNQDSHSSAADDRLGTLGTRPSTYMYIYVGTALLRISAISSLAP